jgi:F-type H+-transporting ATPase subunit epsilon
MRLKILLPTEILFDGEISKLTAEAENGSFCLLPRHIDFVAALVPGILSYVSAEGGEHIIAVDEGTLVKCGAEVLVSTRTAVQGTDLNSLKETVEKQFMAADEQQKKARAAMSKLEVNLVRKFIELGEREHG